MLTFYTGTSYESTKDHLMFVWLMELLNEEVCRITSPIQQKAVLFLNNCLAKQPIFLLNGEVIWQAIDSYLD